MSVFPEILEFLDYISSEKGVSANTRLAYEQDLSQFTVYCQRKDLNPQQADAKYIRDYLASLRKQGLSARTLARKLSSIKQFYKFMLREEKIPSDPSDLLSISQREKRLPQFLTVEQMFRLVESVDGEGESGLRDRALLEVWYATGARVTEVAKLSIAGFDWTAGLVQFHGKGGRRRWVPLTPSALSWCRRYLTVRHQQIRRHGLKETDIFFLGRTGNGLSRQAIWKLLKRYAKKAGIERKVWPHLIRHSFATQMLHGGADLRAVQELLGHKSIATTEVYTHLDIENLKVMQLKYHPRN